MWPSLTWRARLGEVPLSECAAPNPSSLLLSQCYMKGLAKSDSTVIRSVLVHNCTSTHQAIVVDLEAMFQMSGHL